MHFAYLRYELVWALPVIVLQWIVAGRELWRWRRLLAVTVALATLYLAACDAIALGHGIWRVDSARVIGLYAGPLPLEEFIFYFVTNIMAAQGFVMITGYLRERKRETTDEDRELGTVQSATSLAVSESDDR